MNGSGFGSDRGIFDDLRRFERALDEMLSSGGWSGWPSGSTGLRWGTGSFPAVNVGATPEAVHVYVLAPGLDASKLDLNIQSGVLSISGSRALNGNPEKQRYYRQERFAGEFRRVITLPQDVDANRCDAKYRDGVLHITVQRRESARPRQIEIK